MFRLVCVIYSDLHLAVGFQITKVAHKLQPATLERRRQYSLLYPLKK